MEKKKSLGQHFLHSQHYLEKIADAAEIKAGETVLEIGPGDGALTQVLLLRGAQVIAIEKDHRLIPVLQEKFAKEIAEKKLKVIEGDVLEKDLDNTIGSPYKLVANIPYYITGVILKKFLSGERQPSSMVLLVQREVAERIARDSKESILSLSVKAYGTPKYVETVPAGAFSPPPEVDSAILRIDHISRNNFKTKEQEGKFFELLHFGFAHKRKLLVSNLKQFGIEAPKNARAEEMPLEFWLTLLEG